MDAPYTRLSPNYTARAIASLPIAALAEGAICPPLEPDHASWDVIAPWEDPLASRGGYSVPALKVRETFEGQPCITWQIPPLRHLREDRSFVIGAPTWREHALSCRVQTLESEAGPNADDPFNSHTRTGLVFRMATLRRYYTFCLEDRRRLVLYRRNDAEWTELAARAVEPGDALLTLRVELDADGIRADCPELQTVFEVTDPTYPAGLAGFRALGACRLFALEVAMTPGQEAANARRAAALATRTARLADAVPDEVEAGTLDLRGRALVACEDFCAAGRNDLLFETPDGIVAETWEGRRLWVQPELFGEIVFSAAHVNGRRILYGLSGRRKQGTGSSLTVTGGHRENVVQDDLLAVDGATGAILHRAKLPVSPREDLLRYYDLSAETGRLVGPAPVDILVREWRADWGGGGEMLWAFDGALRPLWEQKVHPGYGHHNAVHFFDADGDGRDEVLAGGNLLSADGQLLWRHDQAEPFFHTYGGQHYDAALIGRFADDPELDPCAFLAGGSGGVYVVDGLTGRTRAHHWVGHAQWTLPCRVRDDLPGQQVMVGTRWGNFGILTLFSGRGDRLWSIQPDYMLQGTLPVQWTPEGPQHIWCCRSLRAMGLYDGFGRLVKPLDRLRRLYGQGTKKPTHALRRTPAGPDLLGLQTGDMLHLFAAGP
jgi:hypothetical protein